MSVTRCRFRAPCGSVAGWVWCQGAQAGEGRAGALSPRAPVQGSGTAGRPSQVAGERVARRRHSARPGLRGLPLRIGNMEILVQADTGTGCLFWSEECAAETRGFTFTAGTW